MHKVFDAHVHIFPMEVFKRIWRYFLVHYWYVVYQWSLDKIASFLESRTCGYTTLIYAHRKGLARYLNEFIIEFSKKSPLAVPVGTFHAEDRDVAAYVEDALTKGIRGFKVHLEVQNFDPADPKLRPVYQLMREADAVLHIHSAKTPLECRWTGVDHFKRLLKIAPDLKIVVAHGAIPEFQEYFALSKWHPVYFDLAMVGVDFPKIWEVDDFFLEMVHTYPEKFLFGTDFPNIPYRWEEQLETIEKWKLSEDALNKVLRENAEKLYQRCPMS